MKVSATNVTAVAAGCWSALGYGSMMWLRLLQSLQTQEQNTAYGLALAVFFIVPWYLFVVGFQFLSQSTREERKQQMQVIWPRMLCWLLGAAIFGGLYYVVLGALQLR